MINAKDIASEFAAFRRRRKIWKSARQSALYEILEKRAVFIHVPKCGGKTVIKDFYGLGQHDWFGHAKPAFYKAVLGPVRYRAFFKFSLVRNPIDRCRSGFYFGIGGGFGTRDDHDFAKTCQGLSFEEFVLDGHLESWVGRYVVFYPQHPFVAAADGSLLVDQIYHLDRIDKLFRDLGLDAHNISHQNKTAYDKPDLSPEVSDAIRAVYKRDYDVIGFE
jgi:hypothetical protein